MNLAELQKCEKAWNKFLNWVARDKAPYCIWDGFIMGNEIDGRAISPYELTGLLTEFLDSNGIVLTIKFNDGYFGVNVLNLKTNTREPNFDKFATRQSATESGMIKAFQILEEK